MQNSTGFSNLKQNDNVEKALAIWFDQQRNEVLLNKIKEFAVELGEHFEPDANWLFRWKKRQNIKVGKIDGEAAQSNKEGADTYIREVSARK